MMHSPKPPLLVGALLVLGFLLCLDHAALATTTGIAALDTGTTTATNILKGFAGLGAIAAIALSIWELLVHQNMKRAVVEFILGIVVGIISVNAQAICTALGIGGTIIR
jgi:hypothetical protein